MSAVSGVGQAAANINMVALLAAQNSGLAQARDQAVAQIAEQSSAIQESMAALSSGTRLDVMA